MSMNINVTNKHVLYDMCLSIIAKADIMPVSDVREVIEALQGAGDSDSDRDVLQRIGAVLEHIIRDTPEDTYNKVCTVCNDNRVVRGPPHGLLWPCEACVLVNV